MAVSTETHAQLLADAGLDRPARRLTFTPQAVTDLEHLKRPTKALLERTLRDILLEPAGKLDVSIADMPPAGQTAGVSWYRLPLGRFQVVFRTLPDSSDGPETERVVGAVERNAIGDPADREQQAQPEQPVPLA